MTRAEDRLYVCGCQGARTPPEGCWYELVKAGLERAPGVAREERDFSPLLAGFSGPVLRLDSPQRTEPDAGRAEPGRASVALDTSWAARPPDPEPSPPRPLAPSDTGEAPPAASPASGDGAAFRRGRIVHALLQHLPALDPAERPGAARRYLERPALGLTRPERDAIADETLAVLGEPGFAALFGPGSQAEVPLIGRVAGAVVSGQVDRLAVGGKEALVVDYKSGRRAPDGAEDVPAAYLRQMALYRALLAEAMPGRAVRCALVFTAGPKLVALPDSLLDRALEALDRPA